MENTSKTSLLNYKDEGNGPVLVLLHGFTEHLGIWDSFTRSLKNNFRVVRIDLPGHGHSDMLGKIHTMEIMAEGIKAVLTHLKIRKCVMIGHSMGGYVTLSFASKYSSMLRGFGLFHSQAEADSKEAKINRDRTIAIIRDNRYNWLNQFIPDLFAPHNRIKYEKEIKALQQSADLITPESLIASLEGMKRRSNRLDVLSESKVPVLFIAGKLDIRIPFEKMIHQASMVQHAEILFLGNTAHMGYIEAREATFRAIKNFTETCYSLSSGNHSA
ncbi:MAG: alpha/beta fold hydrolase [Bacteroidales bacterium]